MERIELIRHARRAYRWLANGMKLPVPYDYAEARIQRGLAREVTA